MLDAWARHSIYGPNTAVGRIAELPRRGAHGASRIARHCISVYRERFLSSNEQENV